MSEAADSSDLLIAGLERLEFRGTTRQGSRCSRTTGLAYVRAVGNLGNLKEIAGPNGSHATTGARGTRAGPPHGGVNEDNAHPLTGCEDSKLAIVLNGIVENYRELKAGALEGRRAHRSALVSIVAEVVAHLLESVYDGDLLEAVREVYGRLVGHFTFVVIHHDEPDRLVGVRRDTPMVIGLGDGGENFLASNLSGVPRRDAPGDVPRRRRHRRGHPGRRARDPRLRTGARSVLEEIQIGDWDEEVAEREGFETFMLKEIYEQPYGFEVTIGDRVRHGHLVQDGLWMDATRWARCGGSCIIACGTAYHAGVVGRYVIEEWGRIPVEPDIASEWIYRRPVIGPDTLVIGISQSGETRDTIQAMKLARELGARTVAITNQMGSQITREVDSGALHPHRARGLSRRLEDLFGAGWLMYLIGLEFARVRRTLPPDEIEFILDELLPGCRRRCGRPSRATTRSTTSRGASTTSRSSCSSAGTSGCPSRWKGR